MSDDEFLTAFETVAFTRPEWTHEAHVRMAWLYLTRWPFGDAWQQVRAGIQKLNAKIGSPDGYHETITAAFVRVISARLVPGETYPAFRERNPELFDRTLAALLRHYTKDVLHSSAARLAYVEPDIEPLPAAPE